MSPLRPLLGWALALCLAGGASAHDGRDSERHDHRHGPRPVPEGVQVPLWSQLTPAQQEKLAPMRQEWDTMSASQRVRALERMERRARWEAMSPEEREKLKAGARNFRDMPPELKEKMRASFRAMQSLPEDEQRALRKRWHSMSPEQRRAWLQAGGPGISPPPAE